MNLSQDDSESLSENTTVDIEDEIEEEDEESKSRMVTRMTTRNIQIETGARILISSSPSESITLEGLWFRAIGVADLVDFSCFERQFFVGV